MANENKGNNLPKLPAILNTEANRRFFDATVDQLLSEKDSEKLNAYIGRRNGGEYIPDSDYYKEELTKERTWYQLEPIVYSKNENTLSDSNHIFYDDMVNRLGYFGALTGNHDRLFSGKYYSFSPPIDHDKFVNYYNYYWIDNRLPVVRVSGVDDAFIEEHIVGKSTFNTTDDANGMTIEPPNVEFTSGLRVMFNDGDAYRRALTIEGVGREINLIPDYLDDVAASRDDFIKWDDSGAPWDVYPWESTQRGIGSDYMTVERGSYDGNAWSRSNKWYHRDVIATTSKLTGYTLSPSAERAQRPIIEFNKSIQMFEGGGRFIGEVNNYSDDPNLGFGGIHGQPVDDLYGKLDGDNPVHGNTIILSGESTPEIYVIYIKDILTPEPVPTVYLRAIAPAPSLGDTVLIKDGDIHQRKRFHATGEMWVEITRVKESENQPPLYNLYDGKGVELDEYRLNNFEGNEIFSYKINEESSFDDPYLGIPLEYSSIGQASDIVFENDINTEVYESDQKVIQGYYYYKDMGISPLLLTESMEYNAKNIQDDGSVNDYVPQTLNPTLSNSWQIGKASNKQRVIDQILAEPGKYHYELSVSPRMKDEISMVPDMKVTLNGKTLRDGSFEYQESGIRKYIVFPNTMLFSQNDIITVSTYTWDDLPNDSAGYFEIPKQLSSNPNYHGIGDYTATALTDHFANIIENQVNFEGSALGGSNNYRDTAKDGTLGEKAIQTQGSLLKGMLVSSTPELDVVESIRFSQREYTRFKSKFLSQIEQLISSGYKPFIPADKTEIDVWFGEVLERIGNTTEYQGAFLNTFMIGSREVYEEHIYDPLPYGLVINIVTDIDPTLHNNFMYVYHTDQLLVNGIDYEILSYANGMLTYRHKFVSQQNIRVRLYENPVQDAIPATPAKIGCFGVTMPLYFEDKSSFADTTQLLMGHDGSVQPLFSNYTGEGLADIRDKLFYELELRIFNTINSKFANPDYMPLLSKYDVLEGRYRPYTRTYPNDNGKEGMVRYSREEFIDISKSLFYKWANLNNVNFRRNDYYDPNDWKTWNYSSLVHEGRQLAGHWKGIYDFYFDTIAPGLRPWEMLGFSVVPTWWYGEYGYPPYDSSNAKLWDDIKSGMILDGERAGIDERFVRPNMPIPVDGAGNTVPIIELFGITQPLYEKDKMAEWVYGDRGPAEDAWYRSSDYAYSMVEVLYLMRPADFGEQLWDTDRSRMVTDIGDEYTNDSFGKRSGNSTLLVHGEIIEGNTVYRDGYQQWISDRLTFNLRNLTTDFGDIMRGGDIELGHKVGGFTNKHTLNMFLEGISTTSDATSLQIPQEDVSMIMFTGAPQHEYVLGGILVKLVDADTRSYVIQGYDLLEMAFKTLKRDVNGRSSKVTVGGQAESYTQFLLGQSYQIGNLVYKDSFYYRCLKDHIAVSFIDSNWKKLPSLPSVGGITVDYYLDSTDEMELVEYNTVLVGESAVYNFILNYGDWLESEGWLFDDIDLEENVRLDWKHSANQFLSWANTAWAPDNGITLMPNGKEVKLRIKEGYPAKVERLANGVYSILDKNGIAIPPNDTLINRDDQYISVRHKDQRVGIYLLRVSSKETEHILTFNNVTQFNDVIFDPVISVRQMRLRYNGFRTNGWFGKMAAGGYIIGEDGINVNYENLTDSVSKYFDTEYDLDLPQFDLTAKHLIGYENRNYMDNLEIIDDTQYQFYQGMIREKGTESSINRLLRADRVAGNEGISLFGEWAFKVSEYGATATNYNVEFLIRDDDIKSDPQVVRLNTIYDQSISVDDPNDNVIDIDIDDTERWIRRPSAFLENMYNNTDDGESFPTNPELDDLKWMPTTDERYFEIPNAGYVNVDDVQLQFFSPTSLLESLDLSRLESDVEVVEVTIGAVSPITSGVLIWIANDSRGKWGVYSFFDTLGMSDLKADPVTGNAIITVDSSKFIGHHDNDKESRYLETYFHYDGLDGNNNIIYRVNQGLARISITDDSDNDPATLPLRYERAFKYVQIGETDNYELIGLDGEPIKFEDEFKDFTINSDTTKYLTLLNHRFAGETDYLYFISENVRDDGNGYAAPLYPYIWLDNNGSSVAMADITIDGNGGVNTPVLLTAKDNGYQADDVPLQGKGYGIGYFGMDPTASVIDLAGEGSGAIVEVTMEDGHVSGFNVTETGSDYVAPIIKISPPSRDLVWEVTNIILYEDDLPSFDISIHRSDEDLVDTSLFQNAFMYNYETNDTIALLPVYDPFKGYIIGQSDQNITYKTYSDPARYTNSLVDILIDPENSYGDDEVGLLWWDLSTCKYLYYEQGDVNYRRRNWGKLFPGSKIDVYEWTSSKYPPSEWDLDGTPKNETDFVLREHYNVFKEKYEVTYYFWVKNRTTVPDSVLRRNRTMSALNVARGIINPKLLGLPWFSPIMADIKSKDHAYIFSNIDYVINNADVSFQVNYQLTNKDTRSHTEWVLLREGDTQPDIPTYLWEKMVDSLVGEDAVGNEVPDPLLTDVEKYGTLFRPRQTWFKNITEARKIFVQASNNLLKDINIRDINPGWDDDIDSSIYWRYIDWYADGWNYENVIPSREVGDKTELASLDGLSDGEIIRVSEERYSHYVYSIENDGVSLINRQDSSIELLDTIFEDNVLGINIDNEELRLLLVAYRDDIFVGTYKIYLNLLFFSMINYVVSEQEDLDWLYKTTYVKAKQDGKILEQNMNFRPDPFNNTLEYFNEVKPYQSKIREYQVTYNVVDEAVGDAFDRKDDKITLFYDDVEGDDLNEFIGTKYDALYFFGADSQWDELPWDSYLWDGDSSEYLTYIDLSENDDFKLEEFNFYEPEYDTDEYGFGELAGNVSDVKINNQTPIRVVSGAITAECGSFLQPGWHSGYGAQEVPVDIGETLSMIVDTYYDDVGMGIGYRVILNSVRNVAGCDIDTPFRDCYEHQEYYRTTDRQAQLTQPLFSYSVVGGYDTIYVDDVLKIATPMAGDIDYIWIGHEKLSYRGFDIDTNSIIGVIRGVHGTHVSDHEIGTVITYAGDGEKMSNADVDSTADGKFFQQILQKKGEIDDVEFDINDGGVTDITIPEDGGGEFYQAGTRVEISPPTSGVTAIAEAFVDRKGRVYDIIITNPGSGYDAIPTVTIIDDTGTGVGATANAEIRSNDGGLLEAKILNDGGAGYVTVMDSDVIDVTGSGSGGKVSIFAKTGKIIGVNIVEPGSGYETPKVDYQPDIINGQEPFTFRTLYDSVTEFTDSTLTVPPNEYAVFLKEDLPPGVGPSVINYWDQYNQPLTFNAVVTEDINNWYVNAEITGGSGEKQIIWKTDETDIKIIRLGDVSIMIRKTPSSLLSDKTIQLEVSDNTATETMDVVLKNTVENDDK